MNMILNETILDPTMTVRGGAAPRVLMALWDGGGNVGSQRALARELKRLGCDVHAVAHDSIADCLESDGATFHHLRSAIQFDFAKRRTLDDEMTVLPRDILGSEKFAADVMAIHGEIKPDILLVDCMLISTMQAAVTRKTRFCVVYHLAWLPNGDAAEIMNFVYRSMPGQPAEAEAKTLVAAASLVLVTNYAELVEVAEVPPNVVFVGPIREAAETVAWPRRHPDRPLALVSLSSVYQQQDRTLSNVVTALSCLPIEAIVTTGRGIDPATIQTSDNVEVRAFVDHDGILPLCDLALTHGGLGTVSFSLGAGVPVLCLPNGRDQNDNAARLSSLGLGCTLVADSAPDQIATMVTRMLSDQRLRTACQDFASRVSRFGNLTHAAELVREFATRD